jgi:enamine deaminase RidA (YjgF/YER057c/UK114 family)
MEAFGMAAHAMCRASHGAIDVTTVDSSEIPHLFATAIPRRGCSFREQAEDALKSLDAELGREGARRSVIQQTVFLADTSRLDECRQILCDFYGDDLPATTYVPQPPCGGEEVSIEVHSIAHRAGEAEIERVGEKLVALRHDGTVWAFCATDAVAGQTQGAYDDTTRTLNQLRRLLERIGLSFDQVIRTWLYLGGIVAEEGQKVRYKELNRARTDFYEDIPFLAGYLPESHRGPVYPASTGIGTEGRALAASAIALATDRADVVATPLENPRQTSAYDYARSYSLQSPKFSRAMAVSFDAENTIFISGTASITHSESRHLGDAAAQTSEALDNIEALISEANLKRHGLPGLGTPLEGLGVARVYVKRQEDYPRIREVWARRIGLVPTTYTIADVCRPELLVEIEAIAFARRERHASRGVLRGPHLRQLTPRPAIAGKP